MWIPLLFSAFSLDVSLFAKSFTSSKSSKWVLHKLDFENSDVLFLYSTLIYNNGDILKVKSGQ